jgi:hypothetical protein
MKILNNYDKFLEQVDDVFMLVKLASHLIKAIRNNSISSIKKYIDEGYNINYKNSLGETGIMISSYINRYEITKILIDNGAKLNLFDNNKNTALIYAAYGIVTNNITDINDYKSIILLLDNEVDWNHKNNNNEDFLTILKNTKIKNQIIKKYPIKYDNYLMKLKTNDFNI